MLKRNEEGKRKKSKCGKKAMPSMPNKLFRGLIQPIKIFNSIIRMKPRGKVIR
jgi:hypothetical protein